MRVFYLLPLVVLLTAAPGAAQELAPAHEELLDRALESVREGEVEAAIEILEPATAEPGAPALLVAVLGALYLEAGRPAEALETLQPLAEREDTDPAVLYNAARAAIAVDRSDLVEGYLERAASLAPLSPAGRDLGLLRARQGRRAEGYRLLRPWALRVPGDVEARVEAARFALELDRPGEAEELLDGLPRAEPGVALLAARVRLAAGEAERASELLAPHLEAEPAALRRAVRRVAAEAALGAGRPEQARDLLAGYPADDPQAALLMARALGALGDAAGAARTARPQAEAALTAGEEVGPPEHQLALAGLLLIHGRALLEGQSASDAVETLERAVALEPTDPAAWRALARALEAAGRAEEAGEAARLAEGMANPTAFRVGAEPAAAGEAAAVTTQRLREALRWMERGRPVEALRRIEEEILLAPDDLRPWLLRTRILMGMELFEEALASADEAVERAPDSADAVYQRGVARMAGRDFEAAAADLRRALELAPQHTAAMNDLAVLLMLGGEREEARRLLERVLAIRPDDARAAANLERLEAGGAPPPEP